MNKTVFIIHRWGADHSSDWYPWLKNKLEEKGFTTVVPDMPNTDEPGIKEWVEFLTQTVGAGKQTAYRKTFFIGHSVGCQTILRYLESLKAGVLVGGVVFVGGWLKLGGLTEEEATVVKPWIETPIDFKKVKAHCPKFTAIFSNNDKWVPIENVELFKKKLGSQVVLLPKRGHFMNEDGARELPEVLSYILL